MDHSLQFIAGLSSKCRTIFYVMIFIYIGLKLIVDSSKHTYVCYYIQPNTCEHKIKSVY